MAETARPNVLLILDDQHRFDYLGCAGADWVRTPNLDRLAERGVRFTRTWTNCPVCAPARIALATGLQPVRVGSTDNQSFLPSFTHRTYYQRLRDAGYWVGCCGKLDLGKPDPVNGSRGDRPMNFSWGFTHPLECEGKMHAGRSTGDLIQGPYAAYLKERGLLETFHQDYTKRGHDGWIWPSEDSPLPADDFEDVFIGRKAAEWIESIPQEFPWHYFVSFVGPHDPFDPPTEYADRTRTAAVPAPVSDACEDKPGYVRHRRHDLTEDQALHNRRQYCALIELIDDQVGQILDALERSGQAHNTVVLFASDHGEMLGDHGLWTKNVPYEPSVHVPLMAAGPGIVGGRVSDAMVELIDLNATICDLAGLGPQEGIDAKSFAPVLRGETEAHRDCLVSQITGFRCIRDERYKAVLTFNDRPELYDLQEDPNELHNLADERRELWHEMMTRARRRYLEGDICR